MTLPIDTLTPGQQVIGQWLNDAGQPIIEFPARLVRFEPMATGTWAASLAIHPDPTDTWETMLVFAETASGPWRTADGTEFTVRPEQTTALADLANDVDPEDPASARAAIISALSLDPAAPDDLLLGEDDCERVLNAVMDARGLPATI